MKISPIIQRLRTKLSSATYGTPARVWGAFALDQVKKGSTLDVPALYVLLGPSVGITRGDQNTNVVENRLNEILIILMILDAKPDDEGFDPVSKVHDIRNDLFKGILGFNPSIGDPNYGYDTTEFHYRSDMGIDMNPEWYVHQVIFDLQSDVNQDCQGIGVSNPEGGDDLIIIAADIEPTTIDINEQPALQALIDYS